MKRGRCGLPVFGVREAVDHLGERARTVREPRVCGEIDLLHPAAAEWARLPSPSISYDRIGRNHRALFPSAGRLSFSIAPSHEIVLIGAVAAKSPAHRTAKSCLPKRFIPDRASRLARRVLVS